MGSFADLLALVLRDLSLEEADLFCAIYIENLELPN